MNKEISQERVLEVLGAGGHLCYFFLSGGVALHDKSDTPIQGYFDIQAFLDLRKTGVIEKSDSRSTGYPHYADNAKYDVYTIQ